MDNWLNHLTRQNPAAGEAFHEFAARSRRFIETAPRTHSVNWVSLAQVGHGMTRVGTSKNMSEAEWKLHLRAHILEVRKHWLHLEHLFETNEMKYAATLAGVNLGLGAGNYWVACSMLRSSVELTAWLEQFVVRQLSAVPLSAQSATPETEFFFNFHDKIAKALFPTRYDFNRFDENGKARTGQPGPGKSRPWEYAPKEGTIDRRVTSVLNAIDTLEESVPSTREMYERICEFVHPNVGSSMLLSDYENMITDSFGIQRFEAAFKRDHARLPVIAQFILPDMLEFCSKLIARFETLLEMSREPRAAYRQLALRVSARTLRKNRKYFDPYADCPCESEKKFRFCCGGA